MTECDISLSGLVMGPDNLASAAAAQGLRFCAHRRTRPVMIAKLDVPVIAENATGRFIATDYIIIGDDGSPRALSADDYTRLYAPEAES